MNEVNAGKDGSTSVAVQVDQTGTGKIFVAAKVMTNGNPVRGGSALSLLSFTNVCLHRNRPRLRPTRLYSREFCAAFRTRIRYSPLLSVCLLGLNALAGRRRTSVWWYVCPSWSPCARNDASTQSVKTTHGFGGYTVVSQGKAAAAPATATKTATGAKGTKAAADPAIAQLAAIQQGKKKISDTCTADSECRQGCCGFSTGKCHGPREAQTDGTGGCGFGNAAPNCNVATLLASKNCTAGANKGDLQNPAIQAAAAFSAQLHDLPFTPTKDATTAKPAAKTRRAAKKGPTVAQLAAKQQKKKAVFETCAKDIDCQQVCCGCGHGHKSPNCNVATLLGFKNCIVGVKNGDLHRPFIQAAAAFAAQMDNLPFTPSVRKPKGKGNGKKGKKANRDMGALPPLIISPAIF
jgi:hypothetical protein